MACSHRRARRQPSGRAASRHRRRPTVVPARVPEKIAPDRVENAAAMPPIAPTLHAVSGLQGPGAVRAPRADVRRAPDPTQVARKALGPKEAARPGIARTETVIGTTVPPVAVPRVIALRVAARRETAPPATAPGGIARVAIVRQAPDRKVRGQRVRGRRVRGPKAQDPRVHGLREAIRQAPDRMRSAPRRSRHQQEHPSRLGPSARHPSVCACRIRACRVCRSTRPLPAQRLPTSGAKRRARPIPIRRKASPSTGSPGIAAMVIVNSAAPG